MPEPAARASAVRAEAEAEPVVPALAVQALEGRALELVGAVSELEPRALELVQERAAQARALAART